MWPVAAVVVATAYCPFKDTWVNRPPEREREGRCGGGVCHKSGIRLPCSILGHSLGPKRPASGGGCMHPRVLLPVPVGVSASNGKDPSDREREGETR